MRLPSMTAGAISKLADEDNLVFPEKFLDYPFPGEGVYKPYSPISNSELCRLQSAKVTAISDSTLKFGPNKKGTEDTALWTKRFE